MSGDQNISLSSIFIILFIKMVSFSLIFITLYIILISIQLQQLMNNSITNESKSIQLFLIEAGIPECLDRLLCQGVWIELETLI